MLVMTKAKLPSLDADNRIGVRSEKFITDILDRAVLDHGADRSLEFRDRAIGMEVLVNVAVWNFLEMSFDEQRALLEQYVPRLEELLSKRAEATRPPITHVTYDERSAPQRPKPPRGTQKL